MTDLATNVPRYIWEAEQDRLLKLELAATDRLLKLELAATEQKEKESYHDSMVRKQIEFNETAIKRCIGCDNHKNIIEFYKQRGASFGVGARCKECARESSRHNYASNKQVMNEKRKFMRSIGPQKSLEEVEQLKIYNKKYYNSKKELKSNF